ncbi:MAG TPA: hypothetical protein VD793_01275 [Gemmatimonadales bacterium]|nr:hypothetical protein [Gemmatimonadales bacterium]
MLRAEAEWLAGQLARIPVSDLSPMLNVGSSTAHFRSVRQPWIHARVFAPLHERGGLVTHLDMKPDPGVDLTGDLMDPVFLQSLEQRGFRSVLCSNVLEHVPDRVSLSRRLQGLVPAGGYLLVTVPRRFPYHPDPIDTGFRPGVKELSALFPDLKVTVGEEVDAGSWRANLSRGLLEVIPRVLWVPLPFIRRRAWIANLTRLAWVGRRFSATCVILRRPADGSGS